MFPENLVLSYASIDGFVLLHNGWHPADWEVEILLRDIFDEHYLDWGLRLLNGYLGYCYRRHHKNSQLHNGNDLPSCWYINPWSLKFSDRSQTGSRRHGCIQFYWEQHFWYSCWPSSPVDIFHPYKGKARENYIMWAGFKCHCSHWYVNRCCNRNQVLGVENVQVPRLLYVCAVHSFLNTGPSAKLFRRPMWSHLRTINDFSGKWLKHTCLHVWSKTINKAML